MESAISISIDACRSTEAKRLFSTEIFYDELLGFEEELYSRLRTARVDLDWFTLAKVIGDELWYVCEIPDALHKALPQWDGIQPDRGISAGRFREQVYSLVLCLTELVSKPRIIRDSGKELVFYMKCFVDVVEEFDDYQHIRASRLRTNNRSSSQPNVRGVDLVGPDIDRFFRCAACGVPTLVRVGHRFVIRFTVDYGNSLRFFPASQKASNYIFDPIPQHAMKGVGDDYRTAVLLGKQYLAHLDIGVGEEDLDGAQEARRLLLMHGFLSLTWIGSTAHYEPNYAVWSEHAGAASADLPTTGSSGTSRAGPLETSADP